MQDTEIWDKYRDRFDQNISSKLNCSYMRSTFRVGMPLDIDGVRFKSRWDREHRQKAIIEDWIVKIQKQLEDQVKDGEFKFYIYNRHINNSAFNRLVESDTFYSIYSGLFVFVYMWYHLKSLFLALIGLIIIIFSFPITMLITNGLLGVTYFSNLNMLVIFIVLGIAADDIFVFIDGWR